MATIYTDEDKRKALNTLIALGAFSVPAGFLASMAYRKNTLADSLFGKPTPARDPSYEIPIFHKKKLDQETNIAEPQPKLAKAPVAPPAGPSLPTNTKLHDWFAKNWPTGENTHPLFSWIGLPATLGTGVLGGYLGHSLGNKAVGNLEVDQSEEELAQAKEEFRKALEAQKSVMASDNTKQAEGPIPAKAYPWTEAKQQVLGWGNNLAGAYLTAALLALGVGGTAGYSYGRQSNTYLQLQKALKDRAKEMQGRMAPYAVPKEYELSEKETM